MKEIIKKIKVQLNGGTATAAPPLGPLLSQNGINPSLFVKAFNEKTKDQKNVLYTVYIYIFSDKTFDFKLSTMPISKLILSILNLEKGSNNSKLIIGKLTDEQLLELIKIKKNDFPKVSEISIKKMILGTSKNMGIAS